ncbi:hypothetical protein CK489_15210 [Bradyrhizobium sp. UFLA03-84]|uniref:hypothetical protein n=1 Tax=Bradyrhizobium sp. UFLA03-84 TaxID=418599 RepID=UPI000BAE54F8|nr:hypothetical protein [Bradyrhizobium sp. UFLA03-84]PAY07151.1 hypothetical protein CK489_15210 [Bradyrhizobium sp. UFLA03-84]
MTEIDSGAHGSTAVPLRSLSYVLLVAILAASGLYAAFIAGPAMHAAARDDVARTVSEENRKFCGMFGMGTGTDTFAACSRELAVVRQRQADRDNAAAQGLL